MVYCLLGRSHQISVRELTNYLSSPRSTTEKQFFRNAFDAANEVFPEKCYLDKTA